MVIIQNVFERVARTPKLIVIMILLAEICASIDFITKSIVSSTPSGAFLFKLNKNIYIYHTSNTGISFGILAAYPILSKIVEGFAIALVIYFILLYYEKITKLMAVFLGMIVGGGLSNFFEKLFYGKVTDFIHIYSWPMFNAADSAITLGVIALVIVFIFHGIKKDSDVATF